VREVNAILLTKGTGMSTDATLLAIEHDIPVLLLHAQTHFPLGQISSGRPGNIATVRKNQPDFCRSSAGFQWVAETLASKVANQRAFLRQLAGHPASPVGFAEEVRFADKVMATLQQRLKERGESLGIQSDSLTPSQTITLNPETFTAIAETFRGQEGSASRIYFQQLVKYLANLPAESLFRMPGATFEGRQKRPAYDPFNALLNYLYGMLYTSCHLALLKNGLDPYLGVLHADRHGDHPTLVFDFIEPYRPWADKVAVQLAESGVFDEDSFEPDADERGLWLSRSGKNAVIDAMLTFMESPSGYQNRQVKHRVQIDLNAQQLAIRVKGLST
jgi:CRISPR-associated protein Cas1